MRCNAVNTDYDEDIVCTRLAGHEGKHGGTSQGRMLWLGWGEGLPTIKYIGRDSSAG